MTEISVGPRKCQKRLVSARLGVLGAIEHFAKISIFDQNGRPRDHLQLDLQELPKSHDQIFDLFDLDALPASGGLCAPYFTHELSDLSCARVASLRSERPRQQERQVESEK